MNREEINFSQVTEKGLAKLARGLNQSNKVASVTANNRKLKRQGAVGTEHVKRAIFVMEAGQKLEVFVNDAGVIYQVKLNSAVLPFDTDYIALNKLGADLGKLVTRNQKRFDAQLARKAARSTDKSSTRPASKTLAVRIKEANDHLTEVSSSHKTLTDRVAEQDTIAQTLEQSVQTLERQLESEIEQTGILRQQLVTANEDAE